MSAAPVYPARRPAPRPVATPVSQPRRPRARSKSWTQVFAAYATLFALTATLTFGFSSLLGSSMKEAARQEAVRDGSRAKAARADMSRIRSRVERLSTMKSVDDWSELNGFVTTYQLAQNTEPAVPLIKKALPKDKAAGLKIEVVVAKVDDGSTTR